MMDILFLIGLGILLIMSIVWGSRHIDKYVIEKVQASKLEREIEDWLEHHRKKSHSENRFLLNEDVLRECFPEFSPRVIKIVWHEMVKDRHVIIDPLDGEMIFNPRKTKIGD